MERSFRQTLIISGGRVESLWESPICMVMWGVALIAVFLPLLLRGVRAWKKDALSGSGRP
jgi:TctA family transporter